MCFKHYTCAYCSRVKTPKKLFSPLETHIEVTHSMPPQKIEIFKSLEGWAEDNLLVHLRPVEKCWQLQDFLPDSSSEGFNEEVTELRGHSKELPNDYFVCLVGDMIAEQNLPTYQTILNTNDGVRDETAASLTPWAIWIRAWTAEENRHGDLLNKYLYLSGRVDMRQIEKTIQYLIGSGMVGFLLTDVALAVNHLVKSSRWLVREHSSPQQALAATCVLHLQDPRTENNPYLCFIYTSFQERATFISHGNTARLAKDHGVVNLAQICETIASDEKRHETGYTKVVEKLFEVDPDYTVLAFADMMRKKITMPAHLIYDGRDDNLVEHFAAVAQRLGVYTAKDYADILEFLVARWKIGELTGLSGEGNEAQDFVCTLAPKIRQLDERAQESAKEAPAISFSWIYDRTVQL
ncbi:hypothetical protein B296_00023550 [Ensete ventricosum]|uniref:Acyl-[acyl-carrier-protein] desaturase n=1 Tax=Ensete ventricosum TaxID=4639 RepID=A0A426YCG2_ENSVE|nr:hypothetical protein B296_00023550 [Ensete ventricosum]